MNREFLTQAVIALGVCLAGWMFLVKPKSEEMHELTAKIAERKAVIAAIDPSAMERVSKHAPVLRRRADEIEARGLLARDTSQLYGRIQKLAEENSVAVNNLRQSQEQQETSKERPFVATRVDLTVDGDYQRIAMFLDGLNRIGAYVRPISVQLAPAKGATEEFTTVQLGFEVLRFNLPEELAKPKERSR